MASTEPASSSSDVTGSEKAVVAEVNRIYQCEEDSYYEILGLAHSASNSEIIHAWKRLGCKIHAIVNHEVENIDEAFDKLSRAALELGVERDDIQQVENWNGQDDLVGGQPDRMPVDSIENIEEPPESISNVYKTATKYLESLCRNPDDKIAKRRLEQANKKIETFTKAFNDELIKANSDAELMPLDRWQIPVDLFVSNLSPVFKCAEVLQNDPNDENAKTIVENAQKVVDCVVQARHFPKNWACPTLEQLCVNNPKPNRKPNTSPKSKLEYPWLTRMTPNGLIIGARKKGKMGTQVCVETTTGDGRTVRRLASASSIGLVEVKNYTDDSNHKNLAQGQANWSYKQREDFKELHWVTLSHIKQKNTARGPMSPPTDCCVEFLSKGLQILTLSSLERVLGETTAHAKVTEVCERDGILPPWKRAPLGEYHDESSAKPKKSAAEKWQMEDALGQVSSTAIRSDNGKTAAKGNGFKDSRVDFIASDLAGLNQKVQLLTETFMKLIQSGTSEGSLFVASKKPPVKPEEEL